MSFGMVSAYALMFCCGLWAGVYLVINGHPWFALLIILLTGSLRLKTGESSAKEESKD